MKPPLLSIVTPIHNSTKTLKAYLDSVFASQFQDFELIIVNDCSDDGPEAILKSFKVVYKKLDQRSFSAQARNQGVNIARADLILFLDSDIIVPATVLGDVMEVFNNHPGIAGLIGSYDDAPGGSNMTSQFKFLLHHYTHQHEAQYVNSFWTGCGAIRKSVFNAVGGFNAPFLHGNSIHDIELGYRLRKNNLTIYNAKHIQVKHLKVLDLREWIYTDICIRGVPWITIMLNYKDLSLKLNANVSGIISLISAWSIVALMGASFISGFFMYGALIMLAVFLAINGPLFKFFAQKKNFLFSLICVFYLFVYYINCGVCVLAGVLYRLRKV